MFMAALFSAAKVCKRPVSIHSWVYETTMGHLHNGILLSHEKEENLRFATARVDLENIMLSEISQSEKDKYHVISHICVI